MNELSTYVGADAGEGARRVRLLHDIETGEYLVKIELRTASGWAAAGNVAFRHSFRAIRRFRTEVTLDIERIEQDLRATDDHERRDRLDFRRRTPPRR